MNPDLSVVVPVYCTAWALPELSARVAAAASAAGLAHELVLVDDASPDDAQAVVARLAAADPAVRLVTLDENRGQHRAVLAGLAASRGELVVVMDGDLQDPPEAIPGLLAELSQGYEAVFAARVGRYQARWRMLSSRLFKSLLARLCGLPRGAGMYFAASRRMVGQLLARDHRRPFLVALVGLTGLPVSAVPVARLGRAQGRSAYSGWGRMRAGLAALTFALRERRRARASGLPPPESTPPRLSLCLALAWGLVSTLFELVAARGRAFNLTDEGFRYLLSRAWADGERLHETFALLYLPGQYAYFGAFLRAFGPELQVLRLAEAILGGLTVAVVILSVGRVAGLGLTAAAGAALAFVTQPGYASIASALVLAAALDLAVRQRPSQGWVLGAGALAGALAGWREDSAVLALVVAAVAVALRRRPLDGVQLVLPGMVLGFAPWLALFTLRGEGGEMLAHLGRRLLFLVARLEQPTRPAWSFPDDPFASRGDLLAALFPVLAAVPLLVYAGILVREGLRRRRGRPVRWPAAVAALVGIAYLPQFLWERPDHLHLWAHLHLLAGVAAVAMAAEPLPWRRLAGVGLALTALAGAGFVATRGGAHETALYPCCEGRALGIRLTEPPPWADLAAQEAGTLMVLAWGPGWYTVEGIRPPTRFLDPGARSLPHGAGAELAADLADPRVGWVITDTIDRVPAAATEALRRLYREETGWRHWTLWRRLLVDPRLTPVDAGARNAYYPFYLANRPEQPNRELEVFEPVQRDPRDQSWSSSRSRKSASAAASIGQAAKNSRLGPSKGERYCR